MVSPFQKRRKIDILHFMSAENGKNYKKNFKQPQFVKNSVKNEQINQNQPSVRDFSKPVWSKSPHVPQVTFPVPQNNWFPQGNEQAAASVSSPKNQWIQSPLMGNESAATVTQPQSRGSNPNAMWGQNTNQFQFHMISEICQQVVKTISSMNLIF